MTCGCNYYVPFDVRCGRGRFPACDQFGTPYLTANFTVPSQSTDFTVEVTSTAPFYLGQGIKIGTGYYSISEITSSTLMKIQHDGNITPSTVVVAVDPIYGCYQTPIYPAGYVYRLKTDFTLALYDIYGSSVVLSPKTASSKKMKWGYLGPKTLHYSITFETVFSGTEYFIGITLPGVTSGEVAFSHGVAMSASYYWNGIHSLTTFVVSRNVLLVGPGNGTTFPTIVSAADFAITGQCEITR